MKIKFQGTKEDFVKKLNKTFEQDIQAQQVNNQYRYETTYKNTNYKINLFPSTGTVLVQPPNDTFDEIVEKALSKGVKMEKENKEIFIVHGHDKNSKNSLENILYRWNLKPSAIQDEDSKGRTIIEFLESEIKKQSVAIVLLTPDDIGYSKKDEEKKQPRARQNVILELGMLIGSLTRERCIILRQTGVEIPSDIDGLLYIAFDKEVEEIKDQLRTKLENMGIKINS